MYVSIVIIASRCSKYCSTLTIGELFDMSIALFVRHYTAFVQCKIPQFDFQGYEIPLHNNYPITLFLR
jgi:hypothetical protein